MEKSIKKDNIKCKKKIIAIITKSACLFLVLIMLSYVGIGLFGNFDLKSGACAGGFYSDFYRSELENIKVICEAPLTENELFQIQSNLSISKDNEKIITTKYIDKNGDEISLQCEMKWYWNNNYIWSKIA